MKKSKFKLILCDLGNVLVKFDHRIAVRKILPFTQKGFDEVYQLIFDSKIVKDFEEGRLGSPDFFRSLCGELGIKNLSFNRFVNIWNEIFFDNKGIVALLGALKRNHKLYLISNINELHYGYIVDNFPRHMGLFDKVYLSYEVGRRKPHALIYRTAIRGSGVDPSEILYIDDRVDLIREAKKFGIKAIVFKSVADLKKQLKKMKVPFGK